MKLKLLPWLLLTGVFSCVLFNKKEHFISGYTPTTIIHSDGNSFTKDRFELGKRLFFDPILSKDSSLSCASCHKPDLFFADTIAFTPGIKGRAAKRNVPSIINVGYQPYLLREGGVPTLEMQVLVPIQEENEFNHNIVDISKELLANSFYNELSKKAYNRSIDPYVITRSIALYERSLIGFTSKFDRFQKGLAELSEKEKKGMNLFFSKRIGCVNCHSGFNFTDYSFANTGVNSLDVGRYRLTKDSNDIGRFKVPSLRNVAKTFPYMHNGSFKSLNDVLDHYISGGNETRNKSKFIKPLPLNSKEKSNIIAFLNTLTDD